MKIFLVFLLLIFLTVSVNPELVFNSKKITYKDVITVPHKIETFQKEKEKNDTN